MDPLESNQANKPEGKTSIREKLVTGLEVAKKLPERTVRWITAAKDHLSKGNGRAALEVLSIPSESEGEEVAASNEQDEVGEEEISVSPYAELRKSVGLPEEQSLAETALMRSQVRQQAVELYLTKKGIEITHDKIPSAAQILQTGQDKVKAITSKLSTKEYAQLLFARTKAVAKLRLKGVTNPEKIVQIIEAESALYSNLSRVQIEKMSDPEGGKYDREWAMGDLQYLYEGVQNDGFIEVCKRVGNVPTAHERLHLIGGTQWIEKAVLNKNYDIVPIVEKLNRIPETQFRALVNSLEQYRFLFVHQDYRLNRNQQLEKLIDFISENTSVTPEQRKALDTAQKIHTLTSQAKGLSLVHPLIAECSPQLLSDNSQRLEDELIVIEQLISDLDDGSNQRDSPRMSWEQSGIVRNNSFLYSQLQTLAESGDLHPLAALIRAGFKLGRSSIRTLNDQYSPQQDQGLKQIHDNVVECSDLLRLFQEDKGLMSTVQLVEDIDPPAFLGNQYLSIDGSNRAMNIAKHKDESQEIIALAADLISKAPEGGQDKKRIFKDMVSIASNGPIMLKPQGIFFNLRNIELSQAEQEIWNKVMELSRLDRSPDLFITQFLIKNVSNLDEYYVDGKLTDTLVAQLVESFYALDDDYFAQTGASKDMIISSLNRFFLNKNIAPPRARILLDAINKLPAHQIDYTIDHLGMDWPAILTDEQVNIELITMLLDKSFSPKVTAGLLTDEVISALPVEEQQFWNMWKSLSKHSDEFTIFLYQHKEAFDQYTQGTAFTGKFLRDYYKSSSTDTSIASLNSLDLHGLVSSELITLSDNERSFWNVLSRGISADSLKYALDNIDEIQRLQDSPADLLVQLARQNAEDLQEFFLDEYGRDPFTPLEQNYWRAWYQLPPEGRTFFNTKLAANSITEDLANEIGIYNELFEEIEHSALPELRKISSQLVGLLLDSSNPQESLKQIRQLFEKNNLPDFGKKFRIFEIIYLTPGFNGRTRFDTEMQEKGDKLSPVLRNSSKLRQRDTIYKDLLKVNIESADLSLRSYLAVMQEGQNLLNKFDTVGLEGLSTSEASQLERVISRLDVLLNNSLNGRKNTDVSNVSQSLTQRVESLRVELQVSEGQSIISRVAEMFISPLGYSSIEDVLLRMDTTKRVAHERNLTNPRVMEGQLEVKAGDLLKGVSYQAFEHIIRGGSVAREYIGVDADSDSTPFDTDTSMILPEHMSEGLSTALDSSLAAGYGDIIILLRDRGQFVRTDTQEAVRKEYDRDHYEIFNSKVHGERHFGVRTGFPSTEIDAVIFNSYATAEESLPLQLRREQIYFNIANNGFFIPVVDKTGKVIFSEADYNKYRLDEQSIKELLSQPDYSPGRLVELLKKSPYLKTIFEMDSGVAEGYRTDEHTVTVMTQFEKFFAGTFESAIITKEEFRLMTALHDIGKPLAVLFAGSTESQHEFTKKILSFALTSAGLSPTRADVITALIDQDILGEYIKGNENAESSVTKVHDLAETIGVKPADLLSALKTFYICDAGSYTAQAGGKESLDHLFKFTEGENSSAEFSEQTEAKYQQLAELV